MNQSTNNPSSPLIGESIELNVAMRYCPHLGHESDRYTIMSFPDYANRCHRHGSSSTVSVLAQEHLCLTSDYANCSIYQEPDKISNLQKRLRPLSRPERALALIFVVALIILAAFVWWPEPGKSILDVTTFSATINASPSDIAKFAPDLAPSAEPPITSQKNFYKPVGQSATTSETSEESSGFSVIPYDDEQQSTVNSQP